MQKKGCKNNPSVDRTIANTGYLPSTPDKKLFSRKLTASKTASEDGLIWLSENKLREMKLDIRNLTKGLVQDVLQIMRTHLDPETELCKLFFGFGLRALTGQEDLINSDPGGTKDNTESQRGI